MAVPPTRARRCRRSGRPVHQSPTGGSPQAVLAGDDFAKRRKHQYGRSRQRFRQRHLRSDGRCRADAARPWRTPAGGQTHRSSRSACAVSRARACLQSAWTSARAKLSASRRWKARVNASCSACWAGLRRSLAESSRSTAALSNAGSPAEALRAGIAFLPEERKTEGIFLGLGVATNISLSIVDRLQRFGIIDRTRERACVASEAQRVDLAERFLTMPMAALSGGNQQKALLARVLLSGARILVLFDPTRGVDVGTKQVIYSVVREFVAAWRQRVDLFDRIGGARSARRSLPRYVQGWHRRRIAAGCAIRGEARRARFRPRQCAPRGSRVQIHPVAGKGLELSVEEGNARRGSGLCSCSSRSTRRTNSARSRFHRSPTSATTPFRWLSPLPEGRLSCCRAASMFQLPELCR